MPRRARAQARDKRLNTFFDVIVNNVGLDYGNAEVQDIQSAVLEILNRTVKTLSERGIFNISRIQSVGGMAEKTSLWKSNPSKIWKVETKRIRYIEFDFLAVIDKTCISHIDEQCSGCVRVDGQAVSQDILRKYGYEVGKVSGGDIYSTADTTDDFFKAELNSSVVSSCGCFRLIKGVPEHSSGLPSYYSFVSTSSSQNSSGCDRCTVTMPTGRLQIATSITNHTDHAKTSDSDPSSAACSLVFMWISYANSLFAPDEETLQNIHLCNQLPIFVDFLPAIEQSTINDWDLQHFGFLVPKHCSPCHSTWRKSACLAELDTINKMSTTHRKCYIVLKYLLTLVYPVNGYHLKSAILNHNATCNDSSGNSAMCVKTVLLELQHAYKSCELKAFNRETNLLAVETHMLRDFGYQCLPRSNWTKDETMVVLIFHGLYEYLKNWTTFKQGSFISQKLSKFELLDLLRM